MNTEIVTEETAIDTRLIPLRAHDAAIAKLQPALQYDTATDAKLVDRARKDAKAYAKDQEERHAANERANRILLNFMITIKAMRPTRESLLFGPQLEAIIERGIEDMAAYFHDHLRDHYDARKDV